MKWTDRREVTTVETMLLPLEEQVDYDDYRDVNGVQLPFQVRTTEGAPYGLVTKTFLQIRRNVPVDERVPIVVQIGKWRRLHHVHVTRKCEENKVQDVLRLPTKSDEGDMPQIAVASGGLDALAITGNTVGDANAAK